MWLFLEQASVTWLVVQQKKFDNSDKLLVRSLYFCAVSNLFFPNSVQSVSLFSSIVFYHSHRGAQHVLAMYYGNLYKKDGLD